MCQNTIKTVFVFALCILCFQHLKSEDRDSEKFLKEVFAEANDFFIDCNFIASETVPPKKLSKFRQLLFADKDKEMTELYISKINDDKINGSESTFSSLSIISPVESFTWLIRHYTQFTSIGKIKLISSPELDEYKEYLFLLLIMMHDKSRISSFTTTPPFPYLWHSDGTRIGENDDIRLRVCDCAYNTLKSLAEYPVYGASVQRPDKLTTRDKKISRFLKWWEQNSTKIMKGKKTLFPDDKKKQMEMERKIFSLRKKKDNATNGRD
jgi:hypothetical protein